MGTETQLTAVDLLLQNGDKDFRLSESGLNVSDVMIEFAKLHVEAALKAASKSSKVRKDTYVMGNGTTEVAQMFNYSNGTSHYVDQDSILSSYPMENIK